MIRINLRRSPAKPSATVRIGDVCNLYSMTKNVDAIRGYSAR